jgi:hypothetical protein
MIRPPTRRAGLTLPRCHAATLFLCSLFFFTTARAQFSVPDEKNARSISGQFIVIGSAENSPLANSRQVAADPAFIRLTPALLAISAERIKESLWRELGMDGRWRGQIFLALHPARSLDEDVAIVSKPSADGWSYQVQLPDVLSRPRYARAITGALLLEFANRTARSHSAEIPAWLAAGLSEGLLAAGSPEIVLSSPDKIVNGLHVTQINTNQIGYDPLAAARGTLKISPALTFEELSWPTDAQLSGDDGGVYRASAQIFVSRLLKLKNGPAQLRAMLERLPRFYNWQSAFQSAFRENFPRPLDVEKWWALQVVNFAARDAGPAWTPAVSRDKLNEILSVPVEFYSSSNAMPARAEISLQTAIRNLASARQIPILEVKLRDLELAQLRMAAPLAVLNDNYRRALSDYLKNADDASHAADSKPGRASSQRADAHETIKKLDALDARRRKIESSVKPDVSVQPNLTPEFPPNVP